MSQELRRFKAEIFQALAHPTRIAIVEALRKGELSAGTLIERLGLEQANASQHFAVLRGKQIVVRRTASCYQSGSQWARPGWETLPMTATGKILKNELRS